MFTLALFLMLGGVLLSAYAAAQRPLPFVEALPVGLMGLSWRRLGERHTGGGLKLLWLGDGDEAAFSRLYRADKNGMRELGFSWGGEQRGSYDRPVCWEAVPAPLDLDYVAACQRIDALARENEERQARIEAARIADLWAREEAAFQREGEERLAAVAELHKRMKDLPWAWTRSQQDKATRVFATGDRPTAWAAKAATDLVWTCDEMVRRVTLKAQTERRQEWWDRAADPEIQTAVHTATQLLSGQDEDWATLANDQGWSRAHTYLGHILASLPALGQTEASQALWAVHAHRRQIPDALRTRLFGDAA